MIEVIRADTVGGQAMDVEPQEVAATLREEIIRMGWAPELHSKLIEQLEKFRTEVDKYITTISLDRYLQESGNTSRASQGIPLQGYCGFFLTRRVQENLALLTLDNQREITGLQHIVSLEFSYDENQVTVKGIAI